MKKLSCSLVVPSFYYKNKAFDSLAIGNSKYLELKNELRELPIASKKFWRNSIRPFWRSCLKEDIQELLG